MSSAVNKSQKRFMPKVSSRGPGGRAPARRLSTLRTSFSVPAPTESLVSRRGSRIDGDATKEGNATDDSSFNPSERSSRAQMLGITTEDISIAPESAIEDSSMSLREDDGTQVSVSPETDPSVHRPLGTTSLKTNKPQNRRRVVDTSLNPRRSLVKPSLSVPTSSTPPVNESTAQSTGYPTGAQESSALGNSSATIDSAVEDQSAIIESKPEAPPGYEVIWPEDIPKLRVSERRRKIMVEKELLGIMRRLYAEREKAKIIESSEGIAEEEADALAQDAANHATYNQLKQAVGNEAKALREETAADDPNETNPRTVLDVNKFTMASLCRDIPVGDRNDTYDDYELARVNRRRDTVRVFRAKMWSRRMYQPREEERPALREAFKKYQDERKERNGKIRDEQKQKISDMDDASSEPAMGSHPQAAIEIQANGDISLVGTQFDRHKNNRSQREGSAGPRTEVDPTEQVINSYSFSTRERPDRWTKEETAKFYDAISALGTDFNLISHLFPMRSRNQIKTKFKYEEKRNPTKLQMYLVSKRKFNIDSYSKVSNVPIEEVDSIETQLEKVRQEHEEQMKLEEASRLQAKEEDQKKTSSKRAASERIGRTHTKRERTQ